MTQQFGSPMERDDIARVERGINSVIDKATTHFEQTVDKIAPRAIGSERVPPEEEFREYLLTIADSGDPVAAGKAWVTERASQYGLPKALEMWADYVAANEKRLEEFSQRG